MTGRSLGLYLTSLNCPELWHKSLLWIAIISRAPLPRLWSVETLKANQCPVSFGCWVALNINPVLDPALLPLLAITDQQSTAQYASQSSERNKTFPRSQENWINEYWINTNICAFSVELILGYFSLFYNNCITFHINNNFWVIKRRELTFRLSK